MQSTWDELDWYKSDKTMQKQFVSFVLSVILVVLILLIPMTLTSKFITNESSISVELQKTVEPQVEKPIVVAPKPEPIKQDPVEKKPIDAQKPVEPIKETTKRAPIAIETNTESVVEHKLPSSTVIMKSLYDGKTKLNQLPSEFQVRKQDSNKANEFIYQKVQQPKWSHVTKLIDEELDKPTVAMNFYPIGIKGSVERFMDKITYKKTFTTKYGTKIHCAVTVIIAGCGWK